jgi:predicted nucleic acid-binding protein
MILVDTSVLIGYLKGTHGTIFDQFDEIISNNIAYGINPFIYQELLQGARDDKEFKTLKSYLATIPVFNLLKGIQSHENAAKINFLCRRSGITIRSSIDLLIAETAIENKLQLMHCDSDFDNMSKVVPELQLYK